MKKFVTRALVIVLNLALLLALFGCVGTPGETTSGPAAIPPIDYEGLDFTTGRDGIKVGNVTSGATVHDPSILRVGDTYYIYGSHMDSAKCDDLLSWEQMSAGYRASNPIFGNVYKDGVYEQAFAWAGSHLSFNKTDGNGTGERVWAPDVIYNEAMGKYVMYYCVTSNWFTSNLCYATCDTPDGEFVWQGSLIYSGFTKNNMEKTNVLDVVSREYAEDNYFRGSKYNTNTCPNALDPSVFYDDDGRMWMVYGSWSGGIFLLELDPNTGLVIHPEADPENNVDPYFGKRLLGGGHKSIEAPYILNADGYYYLFVSYGALNRDGGYQIRVYRSETVDGEYVDMNGKTPFNTAHEGYGLKLSGNYDLPSLPRGYMATGHNSAFVDNDGRTYIVYHTRFDNGTEVHSPRVHQFLTNKEGWPCMLPYQTQGEQVSATGYDREKVVGRYYMINQGTGINGEVAKPTILYLLDTGACTTASAAGVIEGTWTMDEGTQYISITLGEDTFSGVVCEMKDEGGTTCMTFSAVGGNESLWGVKYYG